MARLTLEELFDRCIPEPNSGCWIWLNALNENGYALAGRPVRRSHREAYRLSGGVLIVGLDIHHKCEVRCCINPQHLLQCTRAENLGFSEKVKGNAKQAKQTHCVHGHFLSGENLKLSIRKSTGRPYRQCRSCLRRNAATARRKHNG